MIIPVKCFTCGKVLADKYRWYKERVIEEKIKDNTENAEIVYLTNNDNKKTHEGKIMDKLRLQPCCRRHMLTHVDIL